MNIVSCDASMCERKAEASIEKAKETVLGMSTRETDRKREG